MNRKVSKLKFSLNGLTPTRISKFAIKKLFGELRTAALPCCERANAFTLAEVLITLGIIGVVAAMTMPTLVQNYKNREVESKLQKIYTVMNQAIMMSELDNGPKELWDNTCTPNDEGTAKEDCKANLEKYFLKYMKYLKVEELGNKVGLYNMAIYMNDGSLLIAKYNSNAKNVVDFTFYPNAKNFSYETFAHISESGIASRPDIGIRSFQFFFAPANSNIKYHYKKGFEPYAFGLSEYTADELLTSGHPNYICNPSARFKMYCTAVIARNGWKIPKDYPFKVR